MTLKYDNFKFYWSLEITLNVIIAGRLKCCGMEDRMVLAYGCRKSKKLICGMGGKNVVAYGRLPFSTHRDGHVLYLKDFGSFSTKKLRYLIPSNVRAKMLHNF